MSNTPTNDDELQIAVKELFRTVRHHRDQWDGAIATLRSYMEGPMKSAALQITGDLARKEPLELQWKVEELIEEINPPPPPPPAPPTTEEVVDAAFPEGAAAASPAAASPADSGVVAPLRPEDLVAIYEDPRGIMIHRHGVDGRWFLTQVDPTNGQPQTVELDAGQRGEVQQQLGGSPHWIEKEWDVAPPAGTPPVQV